MYIEVKTPDGRIVKVTEHAFEVVYKGLGYELVKKKTKAKE